MASAASAGNFCVDMGQLALEPATFGGQFSIAEPPQRAEIGAELC